MTQAAKAQEPSMEEILASIRRIIADDDATKAPPKAPEPAKPAPAPAPAPPRPAAAAAPKPAPPPPPAPEVSGQDDIDAMFDSVETKSNGAAEPSPNDILDLTEAMEAPPPAPRRIDATPEVVYNEAPPAREPPAMPTVEAARRQFHEQTAPERSLLSSSTTAAVDFGLQLARPYGAGAELADARRPGARDAPADAQGMARRQSAQHGGAHGAGRDRTGLARPRIGGSRSRSGRANQHASTGCEP